jgi:hypothetical protein
VLVGFRFRMFDGNGKIVADSCEGLQADYLGKQFMNLWPPHELTGTEKARVIIAVTSILGASRSIVQANLRAARTCTFLASLSEVPSRAQPIEMVILRIRATPSLIPSARCRGIRDDVISSAFRSACCAIMLSVEFTSRETCTLNRRGAFPLM